MPSSGEIRTQFVEHFAQRDHVVVPPSVLPVHDDPTLMFVNAGMVPFKNVFLGRAQAPAPRVVNSQPCLRVSGKHNDLSDVGRSPFHHTLFEMLGFWSFGSAPKQQAITSVWTLLTDVWGLPADRLYASVFGGDETDGLGPDTQTEDIWRHDTDISTDHVLRFGAADNFWHMEKTGPCGPNTEIHIDLTPDGSGATLVNAGHPLVPELGNIVFLTSDRTQSGALEPLPSAHVDFGAGFERLVAVLQAKTSNYDTDLFTPLLEAIADLTSTAYRGSALDPVDVAYRVVADHARCLTFAIAHGVVPSNDGHGYVVRRILRRAARHARQSLGADKPILHKLVPVVVDTLSDAYPELRNQLGHVEGVVRAEEEAFGRTLGRGLKLFDRVAARGSSIAGEDAFKLHDTYGFPLDLTVTMASERGMSVDTDDFERLMRQARERSRAGDRTQILRDSVQRLALPTTEFVGYDITRVELETTPVMLTEHHAHYAPVDSVEQGETVAVIVPRTPFYGASGGQVGDTGVVECEHARLLVLDTLRLDGVHVHLGRVETGTLHAQPSTFVLRVDELRRARIAANHTSTHLLNLALRHVLGPHAEQRGSLVGEGRLRFDVSHPNPLTPDERVEVESLVRRWMADNLEVHDATIPLSEAMRIRNIRAVFGERYPALVRVVAVGVKVDDLRRLPDDPTWDAFSIELCGGTHLSRTAEIGAFDLRSEQGLGAGVRRLTAVSGT